MHRVFPVLVMAVALGGCAVFDQISTDWFDASTPTPTPTPQHQGESFYSSADGLPMHFLPSGSSQIVGRLALHEHVTRIDLQRGYAQIVADNGLEGWVDNAKLLWRLPGTPAAAPIATVVPAPETATPLAPPVEPVPAVATVEPAPAPTATGPVAVPSELYVPRSQRTPTDTPPPATEPTPTPAP